MEELSFMNPAEERVYMATWGILSVTFFVENARTFLRFVTGSAVLSSSPIKTVFNNVAGLACRPITHMCDNTIELSTDYTTYIDFSNEIMAVLSSDDSWEMDIYY